MLHTNGLLLNVLITFLSSVILETGCLDQLIVKVAFDCKKRNWM